MKPGHIRVFDGLRITTDHLEHLQGSFLSAVQELRLAAGPGRVHQGFEVEATDDGHVRVLPGLAFDAAGNRIACEEPTVLEVAFAPGSPGERYVCLRHQQVEDGVVEGQATIVWDGCSVELAEARPAPEDSLLPIAALTRREQGTGFEVRHVTSGQRLGPDDAATVADRLRVCQGVVRLDGDAENPLASSAFRHALDQPSGTDGDHGVRLSLAEQDVDTDMACCTGLSLAAIVTATVRYQAIQPAGEPAEESEAAEEAEAATPPDEPAPTWITWTVQARTAGEATFDAGRTAQFGLADVHTLPSLGEGRPPCWLGSYLTEEAIAHLPLSASAGSPPGDDNGFCELLGRLQVRLQAAPGKVAGSFALHCELSCSGSPTAELSEVIEARTPRLQWGIVAAWKGLGHTTPAQDATGGS